MRRQNGALPEAAPQQDGRLQRNLEAVLAQYIQDLTRAA
jgi:hypothetical protein